MPNGPWIDVLTGGLFCHKTAHERCLVNEEKRGHDQASPAINKEAKTIQVLIAHRQKHLDARCQQSTSMLSDDFAKFFNFYT